MKNLSEYIIPFGSYSNGSHELEFELVDAFFDQFPESEIQRADVQVRVDMIKQDRQLEFVFALEGWVMLPCDRCLEEYEQPISGEFELFGKFGDGNSEDELDVVWFKEDCNQLDVSRYLYEYVVLSLPMRKVHPDKENGKSGCNPAMLDILKKLSVK